MKPSEKPGEAATTRPDKGTEPKSSDTPVKPTTELPKPQSPDPTPKPSLSPLPEKPTAPPTPDLADPLIATPPEIVDFMLTAAKVRESDVVFDVGCADGRIAMTAVKKFNVKKAVGIDANPDRIASAQKAAANLGGAIEFRRKDLASLTEKDLAEATVITIDNASEKLLADLAPILKKLKVGTRIVTHEFEIPGMRRDDKREKTVDGLDHVIYLYTVR
jgi:precorrin-6B methylase 2